MRHFLLFPIIKRCYIKVKWKGWQKEYLRQVMIWQLRTQRALGMLHLVEQLLTVVCNIKHVHCLLSGSDKVRKSSIWKHMVLIKIKDVISKKLGYVALGLLPLDLSNFKKYRILACLKQYGLKNLGTCSCQLISKNSELCRQTSNGINVVKQKMIWS